MKTSCILLLLAACLTAPGQTAVINGWGSGSQSSGGAGIASGLLSSIPSGCTTGSSYLATDLPVTQMLFICSSGTWMQFLSAGSSGGIAITGGVIDIVTSVVPRLTASNTFSGANTFSNLQTFQNIAVNGTCVGPGCNKGRTCEIHIWGSGTSSALQTTDSEAKSCYNDTSNAFTVTSVKCLADNSSTTTTVTPIVTGGSATSILTGALTCGNGTFAAGTLNGTPTIASAGSIDANVTVAGTAKSVRLIISGTF